ncbi:MAG: DUF4339 domain-containing protein, partial [Verrucomicrobiota bacterium]
MGIHIFQNQQQTGPFPKEAVLEMARLGTLPPDALVWHDGAADWYPVGRWVQENGASAAP